jgi:hypothetical protein
MAAVKKSSTTSVSLKIGAHKMPAKKKATKQRLDPKCWKGYKKSGTKVKSGTRVNNCVKKK